jgi:hypothetical protein
MENVKGSEYFPNVLYLPPQQQYLYTCKYGIGTDIFLIIPEYRMLTYLLYCVFHISCVFFSSNTSLLIIALLGFEFARNAFHCTCM